MNTSIYKISLDVQEPHSGMSLDTKRGDLGRKLSITLVDGGIPYQISPECYAVFTATKPDGNLVCNPCEIDGNRIIYQLTPQTVSVAGLTECEIKLYGGDDQLITSAGFSLVIHEPVYESGDEVESRQEVTALTHLISQAASAVQDSRETTQQGQVLIGELEASREALEQKAADAVTSAQQAKQWEEQTQTARDEAINAGIQATKVLWQTNAVQQAVENARDVVLQATEDAVEAAKGAMASEENARKYAQSIDPQQLEAKIEEKADDLYFDKDTSLLYLMSNGQLIGTGVQVAATGGSGGGSLTYTMTLTNLLDSRVITVSEGAAVELKFSYVSQDADGMDDGSGVGKVIVDGVSRYSFEVVQGENPPLDITRFLSPGSNVVRLQVENSEGAKKTIPYTVTLAAARMETRFDASGVFTGDIPFTYIPTGLAEKTVYFELDGQTLGTAVVTTSGRQQSYSIPRQSHGAHTLRVWFECEIEGTRVPSNVLYVKLICVEEGNTTPIIAVELPETAPVEQYSTLVIPYRVYDPTALTAPITLEVNGQTVANLTVDRERQLWSYRPEVAGVMEMSIRCGDVVERWSRTVTESQAKVEAERDSLTLHLSSQGRSNAEDNPGVWESGEVACQFRGFNFVSDGWVLDEDQNTVCRVTGDARLYIPYQMFARDFRGTGKTIEFELATRQVLDYDAEVISCLSGGQGFSITAQQMYLNAQQSRLGTRYKEDEHIRVTFVVEKQSENRLILCYINGIMSGAVQYAENDVFSQSPPVGITIGSNHCTTDLYGIRVYDNNLTRYQVLDNWIADTQNGKLRQERYLRNQIYDDYGRVVMNRLPKELCYLVLQGDALPGYKGDKRAVSGYFINPIHPERSFSFQNGEIDVQGTSSSTYYVKNYKLKFKNGFLLNDGSQADAYQMNESAVPVSTFTMKADVASSEGAFNVVLAMLYHDLCPFKTPAQQADPRVRQTIEGFPMVIFWEKDGQVEFIGKYNFNNDKGTPEVFGFREGDESWEIRVNGTDRVGWHSADYSDDNPESGWPSDFEARYPDKNTDITRLQQLAAWLVSTDTDQATGEPMEPVTYDGVEYNADTVEYRLAKFSAELSHHFVEDAVIFYYLFTEIFLSIDQREKNAFPTYIRELDRWMVLFYDADSSCGTDNKGNLTFDYHLEDIDYTAAGNPIYNGQNSVLWKNLRQTRQEEIKALYQQLRKEQLSYEQVIGRFEAHQSKWCEAIFNEDMHHKCLEPLIVAGDADYVPMLQGKKEQWMKWWLYNRFRYLDSKYATGTSPERYVKMRAHAQGNITLTGYVNMYGRINYNGPVTQHRMERGKPCTFVWSASGTEDPDVVVYDADLLTDLGDLSPLQLEDINVSQAVHLTSLKVGDRAADYRNGNLTKVELGSNILLRTLDARNCTALDTSPDASGCTNIEHVYLEGTAVPGVLLPHGGILKTLHLPGTVKNLEVVNQPQLADFSIPSFTQGKTLWLENAGVLDGMALELLNQMEPGGMVKLLGIDWEMTNAQLTAFLDKLDTMKGVDLDESLAQVGGRIYVNEVNETVLGRARKYIGLTVAYDTAYLTSARLVERSLSGVYVNDRVIRLGENAFSGMEQLTVVDTRKVQALSPNCFYGANKMKALVLRNTAQVASVKSNSFYNSSLCQASNPGYVYVPSDLLEAYRGETNWSAMTDYIRVLEDYTLDGTVTGALDLVKMGVSAQ